VEDIRPGGHDPDPGQLQSPEFDHDPARFPEQLVATRLAHDQRVDLAERRVDPVQARDPELALAQVVDVGAGAKPLADPPGVVQQGQGADQPPAVRAIGAAQAAFDRVSITGFDRTLPGLHGRLPVLRVKGFAPAVLAFLRRQSGVVRPLLVEVHVLAVGLRGPDDLRHRFGEHAEFRLARTQGRGRALARGDVDEIDSQSLLGRMGADAEVGVQQLEESLERNHHVVRQRPAVLGVEHRTHRGGEFVPDVPTQQVVAAATQQQLRLVVEEPETPVLVQHEEGVAHVVERAGQLHGELR
jgi:hypothetical protein